MLGVAGQGALGVGDEIVGAESAHTVRGSAADVGEEDVTSLVASGILKPVPVSESEHVAAVIVQQIDNSRFVVLPRAEPGFFLTKLSPIKLFISTGIVTSHKPIDT